MFPLSDSIPARKFPILNILLIAVTIFVFVQQILAPDFEGFIRIYALIPSMVNLSEPLTLVPFITAMFLHGGFLHIISNMWFLWVFGDNVEGHLSWVVFLSIYFISGIVGNVAQFMLMPASSIPMLGASGAVAGVLGAYYILFPYSKIKTLIPIFGFVTIAEVSAPFMLGYWFVLQIISGAASIPFLGSSGGVAFFAHIGGFITGVIFAKLIGKDE